MKEKRLHLNRDKSVCLLWGTKKQKNKLKEELAENPLMRGGDEDERCRQVAWRLS